MSTEAKIPNQTQNQAPAPEPAPGAAAVPILARAQMPKGKARTFAENWSLSYGGAAGGTVDIVLADGTLAAYVARPELLDDRGRTEIALVLSESKYAKHLPAAAAAVS